MRRFFDVAAETIGKSWRRVTNLDALMVAQLLGAAVLIAVFVVSLLVIRQSRFVSPISPMEAFSAHETLLVNGGFEGDYHSQGGVMEVNVPDGWQAWYVDVPWCIPLKGNCDIVCPSNCLQQKAIYASDGTVTISQTMDGSAVVSMDVIAPVQIFEGRLFYVPTVFTATAETSLPGASVKVQNGVVLYSAEVVTPLIGHVELFAIHLRQSQIVTNSVMIELAYFAGRPSGGEYHGSEYVSYKPDRITATLALSSAKCATDYGCYWARPEFVPTDRPERVRSGERAQKYFTYGRMHRAGMMQQVVVTPGTWLRFSAWMQAWQCYDWRACCHHRPSCISDSPYSMGLRVGIDPAGGVDPMAETVVWSAPGEAFDQWREFAVVAAAQAQTVTVFVRSDARFDWARVNNDVYVDDAALVGVYPAFLPVVMKGD